MLADREDIEEFADEVREELGDRVEEVLLYGSYARDEHVPGSDIDIAILVTEEKEGDEEAVWDIAEEFSRERDLRFSPKIFTSEEFENRVEEGFSFYTEVQVQGVNV